MVKLQKNDIIEMVEGFKKQYDPYGRYASFDYCYNYFHPSNKNDLTKDIEKSCIIIGFYLASWGMFRGSSFILEKSSKYFKPLIEYITSLPNNAWDIDADNFNDENIDFLLEQYNSIKNILIKNDNAHLTLITKIMLGVFASVPAYDRFFINSFRDIFKGYCGFTVFNKKSLQSVSEFYQHNQSIISKIKNNLNTVDFVSGEKTDLGYTNSKIIDMYGFTKGLRQNTL